MNSALLTDRQRQVLALVAIGATTKQIAVELEISVVTVKMHVREASKRLSAHSRSEAVARAISLGLITLPRDRSGEPH